MNNFGVIEVASTKTTNAPGWAYVPDTRPASTLGAGGGTGTASRKRARNAGGPNNNPSYADLTARQEAKVRKELEVLDRDNSRDIVIPIPSSRNSSRTGGKHTPNVRKILQSQKTFANHLDDFVASGAGMDLTGAGTPTAAASSRAAAAAASAAISRVRAAGSGGSSPSQQAQRRKSEAITTKSGSTSKQGANNKSEDVEMTDAGAEPLETEPGTTSKSNRNSSLYLKAYGGNLPPAHKSDDDPLLASTVPPLPSDEEIRALLSAPPLTYLDAKAGWNDEDRRYPTRVFCAVCGYWGRVRCMKCGVRVCALECLETHREECVTRYGL